MKSKLLSETMGDSTDQGFSFDYVAAADAAAPPVGR